MYVARHSKSYKRDLDELRSKSYRRNLGPLPPGTTALASSLLSSSVMSDARDVFSRGKKSKLARALAAKNRKKNSSDPISPEVEDKSKEWHGRGNREVTEIEEVESYEEDLAELADLEELGVLGADQRSRFTISFKKDRPKLTCDGDGHNLEIVGGDQDLNLSGVGIEHNGKRMIPLGYLYLIVYETDKHHLEDSNGYPESYEHYFGEEYYKKFVNPDKYKNSDDWFGELLESGIVAKAIEKGLLPMGVYNKTDSKILVVGGDYEVKDVGIRN